MRVFTTCAGRGSTILGFGQKSVHVFIQSGLIKITYSAPSINVGLITPATAGQAGSRDRLYPSVKVNTVAIDKSSYKEYVFTTFNSAFDLSADTITNYSTPVFYYGTSGYTSSTSYMTATTWASNTITLEDVVNTFGGKTYFGAYYTPKKFTLTLQPNGVGTFKTDISGFTNSSGNVTTDIYYDNNYKIPIASTLMTTTKTFAGWQKVSGNGPSTIGDNGQISGSNITGPMVYIKHNNIGLPYNYMAAL